MGEKRSVGWGPTEAPTGVVASTVTYNVAEAVGGAEKRVLEVLGSFKLLDTIYSRHCDQMSGETMEAKTTLFVSKPKP